MCVHLTFKHFIKRKNEAVGKARDFIFFFFSCSERTSRLKAEMLAVSRGCKHDMLHQQRHYLHWVVTPTPLFSVVSLNTHNQLVVDSSSKVWPFKSLTLMNWCFCSCVFFLPIIFFFIFLIYHVTSPHFSVHFCCSWCLYGIIHFSTR